MRSLEFKNRLGWVAIVGGLLVQAGCGDDAPSGAVQADSSVPNTTDPTGSTGDGAVNAAADAAVDALDAQVQTDAQVESALPSLPKVLTLTGCADQDAPPLCSVTQTGGTFTANCGGARYVGTLAADRAVTLTAPESTNEGGAKVNFACTGKLQVAGNLTLDCVQKVAAVGTTPAAETSCALASDGKVLPGVECLELPAQLSDVVVCKEGAAAGASTIAAGACQVYQDGCLFQAECANDLVLSGTVTHTGLRFTQRLKALADAQAPTNGNAPAFLKGADANHTCTGAIANGKLTGSCTAGAIRGGTATSVCSVEGGATLPASCELIAPASENLFALESCDILKNGEGQMDGIGEPVCAFRQTGCIWDIQCGNNPLTKFSGRVAPGAKKVEWNLVTGTPCELTFDAAGNVSGKCTVPGQAACELSSKPAVPGGPSCPALSTSTSVKSHGCGGGPLDCREVLQHGCNYLAICGFTANIPDNIIAGVTSLEAGRPHFAFNGLGEYQCHVDKATAAEVASGDRAANEWYGQCENPAGGMCNDNYNPTTKTGFRGLRVYFDVPAGSPIPPLTTPAATP